MGNKKIGQTYNGKIFMGTVKAGKSRDLVHLQEITHGSGAGAHKAKRDMLRREERRAKQRRYADW